MISSSSDSSIQFVARTSEPLAEILRFYESVGYSSGVNEEDQIFLCKLEGRQIIGSVRLSQEEGALVLRGMYFSENYRGRGLGKQLLHKVEEYLIAHDTECFCVPYSHLREFYGGIGFQEVSLEGVPAFLAARFADYQNRGLDIALMKWTPGLRGQ